MNVDTGKLRELYAGEEPGPNEIPVDMFKATAEQKANMQVKLTDVKSPLGKQRFHAAMTRNQKKKWRQKMRKAGLLK